MLKVWLPHSDFRAVQRGEEGVQAGGGEGVEEGVEGLAAGEDEVAVDPLRYGRVEAQGCGQVHEVAPCDADDGAGVGDDPVPAVGVGVLGSFGEDALLVVVEVWGLAGAFDPGVGFFRGLFRGAEVDAVLLCACGEDDAFETLGCAGDGEGVEEVGWHRAIDVPVS